MNNILNTEIIQFLMVYFLLFIVGYIMKKCSINKIKQLLVANIRMTIQLIIAGLILSYIFENRHAIFTVIYIFVMIIFSIYRVLSKNKQLNNRFKLVIAFSIVFSGLFIMIFYIYVIVGESIFNPQYVIPIAGMIMGNIMTGIGVGIKSFYDIIQGQRSRIDALSCAGISCSKILMPFVKEALETAMLPTINSMVGMGIVSLPGMMTGQILAGAMPITAILYQISIMVAICTSVSLACFCSLYFGHKTLYDENKQIIRF